MKLFLIELITLYQYLTVTTTKLNLNFQKSPFFLFANDLFNIYNYYFKV